MASPRYDIDLSRDYQEIRDSYLQSYDEHAKFSDEPWYKADVPEPSNGNDKLCEMCRRIDFKYMIRNRVSINHGPIWLMTDMIANRKSCVFCDLVLKAVLELEGTEPPADNVEGRPIMVQLLSEQKVYGKSAICLLALSRKVVFKRAPIGEPIFIHHLGAATNVETLEGREVMQDSLDIPHLRQCLRLCEETHPESVEDFDEANLPTLRLIDVNQECVVKASFRSRYIALSYVWGGLEQLTNTTLNDELLSRPFSLRLECHRKLLRNTIKDAMHLVRRLGERFLWVDALCIVQDSPDKVLHLAAMEKIYGNAIITIAATSGTSADAGLPGVDPSKRPRKVKQYKCSLRGLTLAWFLPDVSITADASVWNKRAWTYQERVLSQRLMIVSDQQVFFRCMHGLDLREDLVIGDRIQDMISDIHETDTLRGTDHLVNFQAYATVVQNFSTRQIAFEWDLLNAFAGIMSYFEPRFQSDFLFGLPTSELDLALLWQPLGDMSRRKNEKGYLFPSWAWVGSTAGARYWEETDMLSCLQYKDHTSGQWITTAEYRAPKATCAEEYAKLWRHGERFGWNRCSQASQPNYHFVHPTAPKEERQNHCLVRTSSHGLQVRGFFAAIKLTDQHASNGANILRACTDTEHTVCGLVVRDGNEMIIGTVHVPYTERKALQGEVGILRLSRAKLLADETPIHAIHYDQAIRPDNEAAGTEQEVDRNENTEDEILDAGLDNVDFDTKQLDQTKPWCIYHVMLVVREDTQAYRRVGLGKVHTDGFELLKPKLREILLE